MATFKYEYTDIGYCRVCFTIKIKNRKLFYCLQEEDGTINLLRCSKDWEPIHKVIRKEGTEWFFDTPENLDDYAKNILAQWEIQQDSAI